MSKTKPESPKSQYYWRKRYYPYYWWRRRYYPDYWWNRRWYGQGTVSELGVDPTQNKNVNNDINVAGALEKAFSLQVDVMFMVKALQYARDNQPDDDKIYELVDEMLELYYIEKEMLDEDDLELILPEQPESDEKPTTENVNPPLPSTGFIGSMAS